MTPGANPQPVALPSQTTTCLFVEFSICFQRCEDQKFLALQKPSLCTRHRRVGNSVGLSLPSWLDHCLLGCPKLCAGGFRNTTLSRWLSFSWALPLKENIPVSHGSLADQVLALEPVFLAGLLGGQTCWFQRGHLLVLIQGTPTSSITAELVETKARQEETYLKHDHFS